MAHIVMKLQARIERPSHILHLVERLAGFKLPVRYIHVDRAKPTRNFYLIMNANEKIASPLYMPNDPALC
jgi:hypothetical protein